MAMASLLSEVFERVRGPKLGRAATLGFLAKTLPSCVVLGLVRLVLVNSPRAALFF